MDEEKRLEEIQKMRQAMNTIGEVVHKGDGLLATEIKNHLGAVQAEILELAWGDCRDKNCSFQDWIR